MIRQTEKTRHREETGDRFQRLCAQYGGSIARWPAPERHWAQTALQADPSLAAHCQAAAALDRHLDQAPAAPTLSAARIGAILAAAPQQAAETLFWPFGSARRALAGLAMALILGVLVGITSPGVSSTAQSGDLALPADIVALENSDPLGALD